MNEKTIIINVCNQLLRNDITILASLGNLPASHYSDRIQETIKMIDFIEGRISLEEATK